jgi:serine/threonine protein kinase
MSSRSLCIFRSTQVYGNEEDASDDNKVSFFSTVEENVNATMMKIPTDWGVSIDRLSSTFKGWYRCKTDRLLRIDDIRESRARGSPFKLLHGGSPFKLLHDGRENRYTWEIGSGRYSRVFQRNDNAYKIVNLSYCSSESESSGVKRYRSPNDVNELRSNLKETICCHTLKHPNVVDVLRSQIIMDHGFMRRVTHEMKLARYTLDRLVSLGEMSSIRDLVYFIYGICEGVKYLHDRDVIHGDLKPQNILVTPEYQVVITDYSLTTISNHSPLISASTLFWRSPECLMQYEYTKSSDIWSLAIIILDCLYGTTFCESILQFQHNTDAVCNMICFLGVPEDAFVSSFPYMRECLRFYSNYKDYYEIVSKRLKTCKPTFQVEENDMDLLDDLISHMLQWDPRKRYTIDQVLEHAVFKDACSSDYMDHSGRSWNKMILEKKMQHNISEHVIIRWRNEQEKKHIQNKVHNYIYSIQDTSHVDNWLVDQCVLLSKRLLDRLKSEMYTFHVDHVIFHSVQTISFLWRLYYPHHDVYFESAMYHVLNLLEFKLFVWNVEEVFHIEDIDNRKIPSKHIRTKIFVDIDRRKDQENKDHTELQKNSIDYVFDQVYNNNDDDDDDNNDNNMVPKLIEKEKIERPPTPPFWGASGSFE